MSFELFDLSYWVVQPLRSELIEPLVVGVATAGNIPLKVVNNMLCWLLWNIDADRLILECIGYNISLYF
jgi:hypothetical protein